MTPKEIIARWVTGQNGELGQLTDHALSCADTLIEMLSQSEYEIRKQHWTVRRKNEASKKAAASYRSNQYTRKST